ncbi:MAG TPA: hypothetical protein VIV60_30910, partial [Polyangiaceae bacterium]
PPWVSNAVIACALVGVTVVLDRLLRTPFSRDDWQHHLPYAERIIQQPALPIIASLEEPAEHASSA